MRAVVISLDDEDAARWVDRQPHLPRSHALPVGPRTVDRLRGVVADVVLVTDLARLNLTDAAYRRLLDAALICVASRGAS